MPGGLEMFETQYLHTEDGQVTVDLNEENNIELLIDNYAEGGMVTLTHRKTLDLINKLTLALEGKQLNVSR